MHTLARASPIIWEGESSPTSTAPPAHVRTQGLRHTQVYASPSYPPFSNGQHDINQMSNTQYVRLKTDSACTSKAYTKMVLYQEQASAAA